MSILTESFVVLRDDTISLCNVTHFWQLCIFLNTATLVETYSTSTQQLMHILSTNTHILLCMHNSIIVNHKHDIFHQSWYKSSIKNTLEIVQLKSMGNGTHQGLAATEHRNIGRVISQYYKTP